VTRRGFPRHPFPPRRRKPRPGPTPGTRSWPARRGADRAKTGGWSAAGKGITRPDVHDPDTGVRESGG